MSRLFVDTETCGFHGPIVLIQYAIEDGPITLYNVWQEPVNKTIALIEEIATHEVIGFNLAFDWFHFCQMYTTLIEYRDRGYDCTLPPCIEEYATCEPEARDRGCLKPASACDLMILAQQTKYQWIMNRNPIRINRVPSVIAEEVRQQLNKACPFNPILFAKMPTYKTVGAWRTRLSKRDPRFSYVYVEFAPSSQLKALAREVLGYERTLTMSEVGIDDCFQPLELGYAPFAKAIADMKRWVKKKESEVSKFMGTGKWKGSWPVMIEHHCDHWYYSKMARQYAEDDVTYTRALYHHLGDPETGDIDSVLSCMVGAVRWHGFTIDIPAIEALCEKAKEKCYTINNAGKPALIPTAPADALRYIRSRVRDEADRAWLPESTDKAALKELIDAEIPGASEAAKEVRDARRAFKEIENFNKMLRAGRFHASFKIIGTLSSRMAGADGLNAQGIKKTKVVRQCFPLAPPGMKLCAGDFSGFEVTIADAIYNDEKLRAELQAHVPCVYCQGTGYWDKKCNWCGGVEGCDFCVGEHGQNGIEGVTNPVCEECKGTGIEEKKIHATFGTFLFPGETYESIRKTAGQVPDLYSTAKSGLFAWLFAGTEHTFQKNLGIDVEQAGEGLRAFEAYFPSVGRKRAEAMATYAPIAQVKGPGSEVTWTDCPESVPTLLGFNRYFTLEFQIMRALYDMANTPPEAWYDYPGIIKRNSDKPQSIVGAVRSALYGAAFNIQGSIQRVAINHPIQGTGAQITKIVQDKVWAHQPGGGYHPWIVLPMNIHDEIQAVVAPDYVQAVADTVNNTVAECRSSVVPLLSMDWSTEMSTWADK